MNSDDIDLDQLLSDAVTYARDHVEQGGLPFVGVVVTTSGQVSAYGVNEVRHTGDPTAHAEIVAIRTLAAELGPALLEGATLLATGEPCLLCYRFAADHGIQHVIYAVDQDTAATWGFDYRSDAAPTAAQKSLRDRAEHRPVREHLAPFAHFLRRHNLPLPTGNASAL
ncbi:nucleoside deaminase [Lentzea jiangxiensis]|uniref:tRNA(Arg) A34 adenosine deaminase TadA n=1 Tax=Lentzea jiangxiensis TaxID=641025 RepID=A0A1H0VTK3_9PSEU|nr:nucleoside deaminase [Lentzea jiangxiensis]SDP81548.1 tRNA(Arg) A34 adenosine deaminase TadA [Lentzea jiangxiensis]